MPITDIFDPTTGANGGGAAAAASAVEPPAPTSQATASGVNFTAKTFAAFTDTGSVISSYTAVTTNADGSTSWSGSGLGAYTATSAAGNSGTLSLNAKNAAGDIVATAVHTYDRGAAAGPWTNVLDWSASSENFAAGEATYTIGGLSTVVDWAGTSGPDTLDLSSGVLTVVGSNTKMVYLTINLGQDFANVPLWAVISASNMSNVAGTPALFWQMADDATPLNAAGHYQEIVAVGGAKTSNRNRYWTGTEVIINARTVTDVETTPTRMAVMIEGVNFRPSSDQGTSGLPTVGADLGTVGPKSYGATGGAYNTTAARNQRYMHLRVACSATIKLFAAKRP